MKKLTTAIAILLVATGFGAWLILNLRTKQKYDKLRNELSSHLYSVVQMDADAINLIADVRQSWTLSHSQVDGPTSDAIRLLDLQPSVSNYIYVFTRRLPTYSFLSPSRNKEATAMGMVQSMLMPVTVDDSIHISNDGHTALVRCRTNLVYIFSDESSGLRESMYFVKKGDIEQAESTVPVKAAPSASSTVR